MVNGSVINNPAGRVWNYANDSVSVFGGGNAVAFNNGELLRRPVARSHRPSASTFNNRERCWATAATVVHRRWKLRIDLSRDIHRGGGGTIAFTVGVFAQSGPINGSGTVNFNGGTMNFGSGVEMISTTTINITAGVLAGAAPGVLNFETRPNWTGGTMCSSLSGTTCVVGNQWNDQRKRRYQLPERRRAGCSPRAL